MEGMAVGKDEDARTETDPAGGGGRPGEGHEGLVKIGRRIGHPVGDGQMVAHPDVVEAQFVGLLGRSADRLGA
jgi:hypothetical protein